MQYFIGEYFLIFINQLKKMIVVLSCLMPRKRKSLAEVKAHETEQIRLRTERRLAQLRQESFELQLTEVYTVLALIYIASARSIPLGRRIEIDHSGINQPLLQIQRQEI
jgi:hypothetical protein